MAEDTCPLPSCGRLWDLHTLREFREHHPTTALNLDYQEVPGGPAMTTGVPGIPAGAMVVRSAVIEANIPERFVPILLFRFVAPDGLTTAVEVALPLTRGRMIEAGQLVMQAARGAVAAAIQAQRRGSLGASGG